MIDVAFREREEAQRREQDKLADEAGKDAFELLELLHQEPRVAAQLGVSEGSEHASEADGRAEVADAKVECEARFEAGAAKEAARSRVRGGCRAGAGTA